jgi:hypothetical protein
MGYSSSLYTSNQAQVSVPAETIEKYTIRDVQSYYGTWNPIKTHLPVHAFWNTIGSLQV